MAFVVERIETDEQRAELASLNIKPPIRRRWPLQLDAWAIDRDRGLYFLCFGNSGSESPTYVALADSSGTMLEGSGDRQHTGLCEPHGIDVKWSLTSITIPRSQGSRSGEFLAALDEALRANGYLGDPEVTRSVAVTLSSPMLV